MIRGKLAVFAVFVAGFVCPVLGQTPATERDGRTQDRRIELTLPAAGDRAASTPTKVTLILSDETKDGAGTVLTVMTGHLGMGSGVVWETRDVVVTPNEANPPPVKQIGDLFGSTAPEPFTKPVLRTTLPGSTGAPLQALVFSGGGIKGLAYGGALKAMEDAKLMGGVKRFAGASAGAISATLLAAGYDSAKLTEVMMNKDFASFLDGIHVNVPKILDKIKKGTWDWKDIGNYLDILMMLGDLHLSYGLCEGDAFEAWMTQMLLDKGLPLGVTFGQLATLKGTDLNIVICDANRGQVFIANQKTAKDGKVVDAVRASMSIPVVFRPAVGTREGVKTLWVDGGTMYNYPVDIFDREPNYDLHATMGFILSSEASIKNPKPIVVNNEFDYATALSSAVMGVQTADTFRSGNSERTVFIDTGEIGTLDFALTAEQKKMLLTNGEEATKAFLKAKGYIK